MDINIIPVQTEIDNLKGEIASLETRAANVHIVGDLSYNEAADVQREAKRRVAALEEREKAITRPIMKGLAEIRALFAAPKDHYTAIQKRVASDMLTYTREQEQIRRAAQLKANEAARIERERLMREAAATAAKAQAKAEELRIEAQAEADAQRRADLERRAAETVAKAEAKAEEKQALADMVVAPVVETTVPVAPGISTREDWKAEVTDLGALITAVAHGGAPMHILAPVPAELNKLARAYRDTQSIPGVTFRCVKTLVTRG